MKTEQPRPMGRDRDTRSGVDSALRRAHGKPLLIDDAADAAFASSIARLRGEPGVHEGGKQ